MRAGNRSTRWAMALAVSIATASGTVAAQTTGSIKVHGHWTIDVRSPDGTLAAHREFDNHLVQNGSELLARLLQGNVAVETFTVELEGTGGPCAHQVCNIVTKEYAQGNPLGAIGANDFVNLSIAAQTVEPAKLVLSGLATVTGGSINTVRTFTVFQCLAPGSCARNNTDFTAIAFQPEIGGLIAGQVVSVTVTLTFGS